MGEFKRFCVQDLLGKKCIINGNKTESRNSFTSKYGKLQDYNLKNSSRVYAEDIIATVKNVMNIFQGATEMISNAEINSNFNGLTQEYLVELKAMNDYLNKKKPVKVSDFQDHNNKNGTNIINFERDFRNLIRSTKFICYNIKKPFFLPNDYDNKTPEQKLKRIFDEFNKNSNEANILIRKNDFDKDGVNSDDFDKKNHLDCRAKTNYNRIIMKSPCFNDHLDGNKNNTNNDDNDNDNKKNRKNTNNDNDNNNKNNTN